MSKVWPIPTLISAAAVFGIAIARAKGASVNPADVLLAAVIGLVAAILGLIPALMAGSVGVDAVGMSQASLVGSMAHLFAMVLLAGIAWAMGLVEDRAAFPWWLLAAFVASLTGLVMVLTGLMQHSGGVARGTDGVHKRP